MSSRPLSPPLSTHGASPRPRSPLATEQRVSYVHPTDLTPAEAADLKDHEAERLLAQGDLDGALHALQKAIYLRPDYAPLHAKLARVYWELCDLKSAMACYRKLFAIDPNPPQRVKDQFASLLDLHGYSLLRLGESPAIAIAYLSEAIQLNSLEETYWLHRALAHIQCNYFDKALKDVDHCVNLNGRDVEYFVLRAKLHWKLHMHEKATQDIHKAARLMPEHPEVVEHERRLRDESQTIYAQACRHLLVRNFAEAIKCLTHAAEISPDETKIYLLRASAHRELGDLQTAMSDIDRALSCHCHRLEMERQEKASLRGRKEGTATEDCTKEYRDIATQRNLILNNLALRCLRDKSYQVALNAMNQVVQGEMEIATRFHETLVNAQYYVNRGDAYRGLGNLQAVRGTRHTRMR
jgi:tetratricopeptide (TPR) repeat protein